MMQDMARAYENLGLYPRADFVGGVPMHNEICFAGSRSAGGAQTEPSAVATSSR